MSIFGHSEDKSEVTNVSFITIWAEENGFLSKDAYEFGFGNGGHHKDSGYTILVDGHIVRMGLTSVRNEGKAGVALAVDRVEKSDYSIYLETEKSNFITFPRPLKVKAGSVINFISKLENLNATNSVVSLLIAIN